MSEPCVCDGLTGQGTQTFTRSCQTDDNVEVLDSLCGGSSVRIEDCFQCPVLTDWSAGCCDTTSGTQVLSRDCTFADSGLTAGELCEVDLTLTQECSIDDDTVGCPTWNEWTQWTSCSVLCYDDIDQEDFGHTVRTRECLYGDYNDPSGACPITESFEDVLCDSTDIPACDEHFESIFDPVGEGETVERTNIYVDFKVKL